MKNLKIKEILEITNGKLIQGNPEFLCKNFSKDTRTIEKGDTYLAIKGEKFDGNLFWKQALEKGAECVIVSDITIEEEELQKYKGKTIIKVKDTLEALYEIAKQKRNLYKIPVIAITGSVGKTSTKDIIANVVSQKYKTLKTMGNNNNNIGLPFTILKLQDEEAMVLEMGMNHLGEIRLLTNIAKPDICIITNIGTSHIGNLGSRQNILKAKLEILEGNEDPVIILNNDNDLLQKWQEENKNKKTILTYGIKKKSDMQANNIKLKADESEFTCQPYERKVNITVPVGGEHFILNSLCAISVGKTLKIEEDKIKKGIESFELTKKRMEITQLENGVKIINDAYNASLESMKASLKYLAELKNKRKIAVLGDILELGEYSQKLHEQVGKEVYENKIDRLIVSGKDAKYIYKQAIKMGMLEKNVYYFEKKEEIMNLLKKMIQPEDVILFKASNGMRFFELAEELKKEKERCNNMKKTKLGVIFGGMSTENEVSVLSANSIIKNLDREKYEIYPIYIEKDGTWYQWDDGEEKIELPEQMNHKKEIKNVIEYLKKLDVLFPVLHGLYGEDGTIQGLFELLKKPYIGCGVLASSVGMDKVYTKIIFERAGLKQAKYEYIKKYKEDYIYVDASFQEEKIKLEEVIEKIANNLKFPMFVKPSNSGSSIGVNKAKNKEELKEAIKKATQFDNKILIEEGILGKEVECAVMGREKIFSSCVGEVKAAEEFYSYEAKYKNEESRTEIPANISDKLSDKIKEQAIRAFRAIDGKGLSRVDFFIENETNEIYINEINTLPGFTNISMYPMLWEASGICYQELLTEIIELSKCY